LRRLLDDDLLVRRGAAMTLTPRAAELLLPLRRALDQAARVVRFPGFDAATDARTITVTMTMSTAFVIGGHLARLVAERAPRGTLRLRTFAVPDEGVFTEDGVDVVLLPEAFASPFPRERLYDDRWVVVTAAGSTPADSGAEELLRALPHVVFEVAGRRGTPYVVLDEQKLDYTVRQVVPDNLLIPTIVAQTGGVGLHRHSFVTAMAQVLPLRVEEFPFPVPGLGIDLVWNPRLADQTFTSWLRTVLRDAAAAAHAGRA
jgi:DNA-binding transcriptional LysR family regulator